jgi:ABC-type nitrate/sulfonate/bicarbonate transport system substrate-binding protein
MSLKRRDVLIGGMAAAAVTASGFVRPAMAAGEPEIKKLVLGFGIDPPFAIHITAIEKGWFREAGFSDVSTKNFSSGNVAGEALVAGDIHLWTPGNLPAIALYHNGIPIVVLGTDSVNHADDKLVARTDAGVKSPEDLYRIKIGLLEGSTASDDLHNLAAHYKIDEKRLQIVNLAPPEQLAALRSGEVQAFLAWEPWPYRALQEGIGTVLASGDVSHFGSNAGQHVQISDNRSIWVASQSFVSSNPNATRAIVHVLLRAQRYVADPKNRDEVIEMFSKFEKEEPKMNRAIWGDFVFNGSIDQSYVSDMENTAAYLQTTGRIKRHVDVLEYTYTAPIEEFDPSLVKVKGRWKP